ASTTTCPSRPSTWSAASTRRSRRRRRRNRSFVMAKTLQLEMVTPEKTALKTDAEFVVLPAEKGELGVLPGHEPYWVALHGGEVRVTAGGELQSFAIGGGFAEIAPG